MTRLNITKAGQWVFAGTILSKPIQLGTNVLLARLLGPPSFGLLGFATSMAITLYLISGLGLTDAVSKYVAEFYGRNREQGARYASVIVWSALLFSTLFFAALWFLRGLWIHRVFPPSMPLMTIGLCLCLGWLNLVSALLTGIFAGLQRFRELTFFNLLLAASLAALVLTFGYYGREGAMLAYVCGFTVCNLWALKKLWDTDAMLLRWPGRKNFHELKSILYFCVPLWIGAFALNPAITITFAYLVNRPNGEYALGIFNTANGLKMLVAILPGVVASVVGPYMLEEGGSYGDKKAYDQLLNKACTALIFLTLPLLILLLFWSDLLFLIYGRAFDDAYKLFIPLASSTAIGALGAVLVSAMLAKNRTWWSLGFGVGKSLLLIVLAAWWIPTHMATGLAWAFFVSETAFYLVALEFCIKVEAIPPSVRRWFYTMNTAVGVILILALILPDTWRWVLALPLSLFCSWFLMRRRPDLARWLSDLIPGALRPRAQRILSFLAS